MYFIIDNSNRFVVWSIFASLLGLYLLSILLITDEGFGLTFDVDLNACEIINAEEDITFKLAVSPLALQALYDGQVQIRVRLLRSSSVYMYDIPPTPHSYETYMIRSLDEHNGELGVFYGEYSRQATWADNSTIYENESERPWFTVFQGHGTTHDTVISVDGYVLLVKLPTVAERDFDYGISFQFVDRNDDSVKLETSSYWRAQPILNIDSLTTRFGITRQQTAKKVLSIKHNERVQYLERANNERLRVAQYYKAQSAFIRSLYANKYNESAISNEDHMHIPQWWLDPKLYTALNTNDMFEKRALLHDLLRLEANGVVSFGFLSKELCDLLLEEVSKMEQIPQIRRVNDMNNYGVIVDDFGLYDVIQHVIDDCIEPIANMLFPEWTRGRLDHHHAFTVRYAPHIDRKLAVHMDQSEITVNVCLTTNFTGGEVLYGHVRDTHTNNKKAVLHIGQLWHEATPIIDGERVNLIVWARSTDAHRSVTERYYEQCMS